MKRRIKPGEKFDPNLHYSRRYGGETVRKLPSRMGWGGASPRYEYSYSLPPCGKVVKGRAIRKTDPKKAKEDAKRFK